jgi:hypothetical protein
MPTRGDSSEPQSVPQSVIVRQHSTILYWWPLWLVGFLFGILSFAFGERVEFGGHSMWFHPSPNLGVIYVTVFAVVFLRTSLVLRGIVSLLVMLAAVVLVLVLSLFGWWNHLFSLADHLSVHMDAGFYLLTSAVVFLSWTFSVFVFDRFRYCEFRPGQLLVCNLVEGGIRTFDTRGMAVYKLRDDLLRHCILGLGTGDLHIATSGAEGITLDLHNVAFIGRKLKAIERLVAMQPAEVMPSADTGNVEPSAGSAPSAGSRGAPPAQDADGQPDTKSP